MEINRQTYEEFLLLYVDGELSATGKLAVEAFLRDNPDLHEELELLQDSVFKPDQDIVFEHKEELLKEERRVVPISWWRISAAAILLLGFGIAGWLYISKRPGSTPQIAATESGTHAQRPSLENSDKEAAAGTKQPADRETTVDAHSKTNTTRPLKYIDVAAHNSKGTPEPNETAIVRAQHHAPKQPSQMTRRAVITSHPEPQPGEVAVEVKPRALSDEINEPAPEVTGTRTPEIASSAVNTQPQQIYDEPQDNDIIYFANTSVSKRNKFRGVFRKATRLLDKVTSSQ